MVPRGDRSGAIIEPMLTDQWFVEIAPLAKPAIEAWKTVTLPLSLNSTRTLLRLDARHPDWCISRQQWWGHRIPAFYDDGNIYVAADEASARAKYGLADAVELQQDQDVLETWFSSSLWPFATLGWPEETDSLAEFLPSNTLITGHDIIFLVAWMIMMTLRLTQKIPFKTVYIHGLVRDGEARRCPNQG